jgi:murein L,D-transpeptidase YcbB/YkuD
VRCLLAAAVLFLLPIRAFAEPVVAEPAAVALPSVAPPAPAQPVVAEEPAVAVAQAPVASPVVAVAEPAAATPGVAATEPATVSPAEAAQPASADPTGTLPDLGAPPVDPAAAIPPVVAPPPRPLTPEEQIIANATRSTFLREVLGGLYASREWRPIWLDAGAARELVAAVRESDKQGLSPKAYGLDELEPLVDTSPKDLKRDVILSRAFVRLAFDLRYGRIPVSKFGAAAASTKRLAGGENSVELATAIETKKVREFLERMQPPFALYKRLGTALEDYRKIAAGGGWKTVETGPTLRPGTRDRRVAQLRKRLAASGDLAESGGLAASAGEASDRYEGDIVEAVKSFQARHGLERDGVAGPKTIDAMNVPAAKRVDQIRATMERTRQFLHDLPSRFVVVNIAAFSAYLIDGGQPVWSSRIIAGKPNLETPVFRAMIESFILNPEWNVPPSIVRDELLPGLAKDPRKLEKMHIRRVGERYVQQAGVHNSLGRIKFHMPNEHAVYLHDTPSKNLFERRERAFSHGCVRLENPFQLAALLLDDPARDAAALEKEMQNGKTKWVKLREPVPVLVMTWSVVVSGDGRVDFLTDLYGHDEEVLAGLDGTPLPPERKVVKKATPQGSPPRARSTPPAESERSALLPANPAQN